MLPTKLTPRVVPVETVPPPAKLAAADEPVMSMPPPAWMPVIVVAPVTVKLPPTPSRSIAPPVEPVEARC